MTEAWGFDVEPKTGLSALVFHTVVAFQSCSMLRNRLVLRDGAKGSSIIDHTE
jgi:hypothetical protein